MGQAPSNCNCPAGPQGVMGPQGYQGVIGLQGPQGNEGVVGPQGLQGVMGLQGNDGLQGVMGLQGEIGPQGLMGPQGLQGNEGPQGPQGLIGPQGLMGPQGLKGDIGPQGPAGSLAGSEFAFMFSDNSIRAYEPSCVNTAEDSLNFSKDMSSAAEQKMFKRIYSFIDIYPPEGGITFTRIRPKQGSVELEFVEMTDPSYPFPSGRKTQVWTPSSFFQDFDPATNIGSLKQNFPFTVGIKCETWPPLKPARASRLSYYHC